MLRKGLLILLAAILTLVAAEAGVRTFADDLPQALPWGNLEIELKAERMSRLQRMGVRASVAFVGSSMTDVGIDPDAMDIDSAPDELPFNAAIFATDARTMAFVTEHLVVPRLRPRVVVIGVSSFDLNDRGLTQKVGWENIERSPEARRVLGRQALVERIDRFANEHSAIVRHRNTLRSPTELTKERFYKKDVTVSPVGLLNALPSGPAPYEVSGFFKNLARNKSYRGFTVGGSQLRALDRTIGLLRSKGIGVVVVKMPLTKDAVALHPRGAKDYEAFKSAVRDVVKRHGVQYVDVPTATNGRFGFYDPVHLNSLGKQYFSKAIGRVVDRVLASSAGRREPGAPTVDAPDVAAPAAPAPDVDVPDASRPAAPDADTPPAPTAPANPPPAPIVIPAPGPDTVSPVG